MSESAPLSSFLARTLRRRSFLRVAGASVAASTLVLAGCVDDPVAPETTTTTITLGTGETAVLNYAYLLEQLEAAFYQKVLDSPPTDLRAGELQGLTDLRDHEVVHRELIKQLLGTNAISTQTFDFSSLTLTSRTGVLDAARMFEDLGVAAYNGLGKLLTTTATLVLISKIASVEARHAAFVHDMAQVDPFANVVETSGAFAGLGAVLTPAQVMTAIQKFFTLTINIAGLPTA